MKNHKKLITLSILLLILISLIAVYNIKKYTKPKSEGIFYKVESNGNSLYLGGTIHIGKNEPIKFSKAVENAYEKSTTLVVETDITNTSTIRKYGKDVTYSSGDNLYKHITPAAKKHIEPIMKKLNLNLDTYKNDTLGYLYSTILNSELLSDDANSYGFDYYFLKRAKNDNKKIVALEDAKTQAAAINAGGDAYQNYQLENMLYPDDAKKAFNTQYNAVLNGDVNYFEKYDFGKNSNNKAVRDYYNSLILQRNINMYNKIKSYISSGKKYFIVVGTGHVLGPDGLVKMLKKDGFTVTRLK
ncbi:hypothetical protein BJV85_002228 [Clostridium acetobutylicum]|uniref:Uncharacterized conserved protein, TraB family n=2 Tax=Clostridium acetobutylicum TaxID=1488 RepID=Q97I84_CLOAB|nr:MULTISPECIES: TraB/GumN family protein [Clostridium]AAK79734.1 Uncharacterized conserved protein, TraB family [Clostridium acetobutylicum ATCC 824]ADZ20818.1 Conserved hypothetical protein [Clostridium acetobutylicum EA 2018]AEI31967.1 hypothetical protein SMB_G1793 [Clostridium acetobutylicum DSM 1731]AWV79831.1 hypothetical protein DK921_06925 [Clostridium acetobutylicum]MBC2394186.1 hypothetical protein [Clostridium acetobutylicum]